MSSSDSPDRRQKRRRRRDEDASESRDRTDPSRDDNSEGSGEDLLNENMVDDYKDLGVLDKYDEEQLDDKDYQDMSYDARRAAEDEMADRDRREGRRTGRLGAAAESDDDEAEEGGFREQRRRRRDLEQEASGEQQDDLGAEPFNLETFTVPLREWVSQPQTRAEIKRRFKQFLQAPAPSGEKVHERLIDDMCQQNFQSLEISYLHLSHVAPVLAIWLADVPREMLMIFDETAKEVVLEAYPDYWLIQDTIHVRITQLPLADRIRDMRQAHLNALVKVSGVVVRRSGVNPQLKVVKYNCIKCGSVTPPVTFNGTDEPKIGSCPECQSQGPFQINTEQTVYRNYQRLILQESPGSVPAGRMPQSKAVIVLADLIDVARPGEEVEVTGIYQHTFEPGQNIRTGFPVFGTTIEANYIQKKSDSSASQNINEEDKNAIEELRKDPKIVKRIVKSIAPSIYGNEHVKLGVALAMFGGREKDVNGKHRIRGDINVLVLGDPGTAKSQVLKYTEKTASRCVYTTGKGASAVGLTAAVHKDPLTGEWVLEGGALVLADRGVCCIDEFDKMTDQDRTSIHEAMEQQSISISKAGIVTSLQARCAVIAAANPIGGRYDASKTFAENVQLTDPILTRFDVLCVLRDEVDAVADERLATFVVQSHVRSHPVEREKAKVAAEKAVADGGGSQPVETTDKEFAPLDGDTGFDDDVTPIPQALLKKYIIYARDLKPALTNIDQEKVARLYSDLRKESEISQGIPIAVRHIESIMRISEAVARMRLSSTVSDSDLNIAIKVMLESFITAQKLGVQKALRVQFSRYLDVHVNHNDLLMIKLRELVSERQGIHAAIHERFDGTQPVAIKLSDLAERAKGHGITDLAPFLEGEGPLKKAGFKYDPSRKLITKTF